MLSVVESLLLLVVASEIVLGILGNGFIGLVNCIDYLNNKKLSKIDFILTGLAIARICMIWLITVDGYIVIFSPHMYTSGNVIEYIGYLWLILNLSNIWFASILGVVYFLKIANFSHSIFLWLKRRVNMVLIFLLGCLFMSWLFAFPQIMKMMNANEVQHKNNSWRLHLSKAEFFINHIFLQLGAVFFFVIALIPCFLLILSLWRHKRRMQLNATGSRDLSTEAHVKAMKVLIPFIILFILYFIGIAVEISCFFMD
jgi:taste receptor type 2